MLYYLPSCNYYVKYKMDISQVFYIIILTHFPLLVMSLFKHLMMNYYLIMDQPFQIIP